MVHLYHDRRIATPDRARPDRRPHGKTPPQGSQGARRISRHVPGRSARRYRAPRLRRQNSLQFGIAQAHSRPEKVLCPRSRFQGQPPPYRNQGQIRGQEGRDREENVREGKMTGDELIEQFENGATPADTFHHADHIRLAFEYLCRYSMLDALGRFSAALKRFATAQGRAQRYHEMITWAYIVLIRERIALADRAQTWEE